MPTVQPTSCCIKATTDDDFPVLLRSAFDDKEFEPLRYHVLVTMHTPYGPQSWTIDISRFPLDENADKCPVCVLAVWVHENSRLDLIVEIAKQPKTPRV